MTEKCLCYTHSRVDEDHSFTSIKTPSFRSSQVFCARHTLRSLLISQNTLIGVLLRNTLRSPCLFRTHSDHRASSEHTHITVPFQTHSDHSASHQYTQIITACSVPHTLIKSLFTPEHSHTTVNFSKHYNKTEVPPTLTQNAESLPIRTYAHLCRRFSVRTLSQSLIHISEPTRR